MKAILRVVLLAASALMFSAPAWAHAHLMASEPAADAAVSAPATLALHFSQALDAAKSTVALTGPGGKAIAVKLQVTDQKTVSLTPAAPLVAGHYSVSWIAVTETDGHKTEGTYQFTVN